MAESDTTTIGDKNNYGASAISVNGVKRAEYGFIHLNISGYGNSFSTSITIEMAKLLVTTINQTIAQLETQAAQEDDANG